MDDKYLTVIALTKYLKYKFDSDDHLRTVFLKGEVSNFKAHQTGHLYFSIKDEYSKINAIMFSSSAKKLTFKPKEGDKVLLKGRVSIYESTGGYQIYVDSMELDGIGNLYIAFEKLKKELAKEGLFDSKYKKPIPKIPDKVGIITAPVGAAIKDILSTIERRFPFCETYLFPSLVQGEFAASDIAKKIKQADDFGLDVLIVGRGGGSIEDLWPFNEEVVARAIFEAKTPIISAVGHEVDFTIADFVADLRAPTPTGAAEMCVPNQIDLQNHLMQLTIRLKEAMQKKIENYSMKLKAIFNSFVLKNPQILYENKRQQIDIMNEKMKDLILQKLEIEKVRFYHLQNHYLLCNPEYLYKDSKNKLGSLIEKLELLNPLSILKKGYSLTYKDSDVIKSVKKIRKNDELIIQLSDGKVSTVVKDVKENKDEKNDI